MALMTEGVSDILRAQATVVYRNGRSGRDTLVMFQMALAPAPSCRLPRVIA